MACADPFIVLGASLYDVMKLSFENPKPSLSALKHCSRKGQIARAATPIYRMIQRLPDKGVSSLSVVRDRLCSG